MPFNNWFADKCERCVADKDNCEKCKDNIKYRDYPHKSYFLAYCPVCPRGYEDCVRDPAYIKFHYPTWYKNLYGDKTPEEAIYVKGGCWDSYQNDPEMEEYCYDDEDK